MSLSDLLMVTTDSWIFFNEVFTSISAARVALVSAKKNKTRKV